MTFFDISIITIDDQPTYQNYPSNTSEYDETFINIVRNNCSAFTLFRSFNATTEEDYTTAWNTCKYNLKAERIDAFLVLPANFSESVVNNSDSFLIYYVDGSDLMSVSALQVSLQEPIGYFKISTNTMANFTMMIPYLEFDVPFWESQVLNFAASMILPMIILGLMINLTSLSIVSEGPLPRMLLTPTGKKDIIVSKLVSYSIIMFLQCTEIFVATAAFGIFVLGSLFNFYLSLLLIGFCGVCMGLFISAISKTEQVANQLFIMFFIVIVMFSGSFLPADLLPEFMQAIIDFLPLGHAIPLLTDISLRGLGLNLTHVGALLIIGLVFLLASYIAYRFKEVEV